MVLALTLINNDVMEKPAAVKSVYFTKAENKAEEVAKDKSTMMKLLSTVLKLADKLTNFGRIKRLKENLYFMVRMLKAYYEGRYKALPWKTLVKIVGALLYFVFIIDFIPDFIPIVGYIDDAAVVLWVWKSIQGEIEKYKLWEQHHVEEDQNDPTKAVASN